MSTESRLILELNRRLVLCELRLRELIRAAVAYQETGDVSSDMWLTTEVENAHALLSTTVPAVKE